MTAGNSGLRVVFMEQVLSVSASEDAVWHRHAFEDFDGVGHATPFVLRRVEHGLRPDAATTEDQNDGAEMSPTTANEKRLTRPPARR